MAQYISYTGDNDDRRALRDLVSWFGFRKSLFIWREFHKCVRWLKEHPEGSVIGWLNSMSMALKIGGVSGHPVHCLIKRFFGEAVLEEWSKA